MSLSQGVPNENQGDLINTVQTRYQGKITLAAYYPLKIYCKIIFYYNTIFFFYISAQLYNVSRLQEETKWREKSVKILRSPLTAVRGIAC